MDVLVQSSYQAAAAQQHGEAPDARWQDSLASLLEALAAVYGVAPDLWLDEGLRFEVMGEFMEYVARHNVLAEVPPVFVAYVGVLTSLAAGQRGAQVQRQPSAAHATFHFGLGVLPCDCLQCLPVLQQMMLD